MAMMKVSVLTSSQKHQIVAIWNAEYPQRLQYPDIHAFDAYLDKLGDLTHFISRDENGVLTGWLATFDRDGERWFVMLVDAHYQGRRIGSQLLDTAKKEESVLNGWAADHNNDVKSDGTIYRTPMAFYLKNGFEVLNDMRFEKNGLSLVKIRWRGKEL